MKRDISAVIFDLDGVIVHTDIYHYNAWKRLADRLGIPFSQEINHRLRGVSRMESLDIVLSGADRRFSDGEKQAMAHEKNETYKTFLRSMKPGDVPAVVTDTLERLRRGGFRLAIGSSSRNAGLILRNTGTARFFDAVSDGNNISNSKPDPEVFLKAAEFLGEKPENCVIVEDAEAGIEAGRRAGMKTVSIGEAVQVGLADFHAADFADIADILENKMAGCFE